MGRPGSREPSSTPSVASFACFVSADDDYFALGGTSLGAMDMADQLGVTLGYPVEVGRLLRAPTPRLLAASLLGGADGLGRHDPLMVAARDHVLPADVRPGDARNGDTECVLVTGATGFLGAHLVASLLREGVPRVLCLVRGDSDLAARQRVLQTMIDYELPEAAAGERVLGLAGDLSLPLLGLGDERFQKVADTADVIYHCGAWMNFSLPYSALSATNVAGTLEVLRLACAGRRSELHYISTTDARVTPVVPEAPISIVHGSREGYVLSKKSAEHLVLEGRRRGLDAYVYRPWQLTSSRRAGALGPRDQIALCLRAILDTGLAPAESPVEMRVLPVDEVADRLAELRGRPRDGPSVVHFFNDEVRDFDALCRQIAECGRELQRVPFGRWRIEVARRSAGEIEGLAALLAEDASQQAPPGRVEHGELERALGRPVRWDPDDSWVPRTIDRLRREGHLHG